MHKFDPDSGDPMCVRAFIRGPIGKTKSRERGNDDIKRVRGIEAVCRRIREKRNYFEHLSKRSWPAMRKDKRHGSRSFTLLVYEVDLTLVSLESVMAESRDPIYLFVPVKTIAPVA